MSEEENYYCEICEDEFEKEELNDEGRCEDCKDHMECSECSQLFDQYDLNYNEHDGYNYCDNCFECPHTSVTPMNVQPDVMFDEVGCYNIEITVRCDDCGETLGLYGRVEV